MGCKWVCNQGLYVTDLCFTYTHFTVGQVDSTHTVHLNSGQSPSQSPSVTHSNTHWQANEAPAGSFNQRVHSYVFMLFQREAGMQLQTCFVFFPLNLEKESAVMQEAEDHVDRLSFTQSQWITAGLTCHEKCVHGRDCSAGPNLAVVTAGWQRGTSCSSWARAHLDGCFHCQHLNHQLAAAVSTPEAGLLSCIHTMQQYYPTR